MKVLVVGNPVNTNALIAQKNAPDLEPKNFTSMMMLDANRFKSQIAQRLNVSCNEIYHSIVWGNHSDTQVPDLVHATLNAKSVLPLIEEEGVSKVLFKKLVGAGQKY